ncbi:CoxG family protein [Sandaracinobacteroides saxicola]|uniref:Carbon monoxide dehydrogenase subunit G n=1 Tax=Sandaracinobacteroides saxicola TaxID=2759707 RepID=A0A7G5IK49_9SPHN|nr:carbon monoxide dehydrogenase subunit G [Sandaracinobacteroides saxicola]QMW23741.1 carbon monoxide dehydrogenase subunit G [Sandaracinobacteroides saxicola]
MELKGETRIAAPRAAVWAALNDPAILARCIDGVESLTASGDNRFSGVLNARVGPVRAKFSGDVELTELDPPNRYVLVGEGKGGVAGFAKGSAEVVLSDADGGTHLAYLAKSTVGGKLAQLGSRLIEGAAKGYAESFFEKFKAEVEGPPPGDFAHPPVETDGSTPRHDAETLPGRGISPLVWGSALVLLVLALLAWLLTRG